MAKIFSSLSAYQSGSSLDLSKRSSETVKTSAQESSTASPGQASKCTWAGSAALYAQTLLLTVCFCFFLSYCTAERSSILRETAGEPRVSTSRPEGLSRSAKSEGPPAPFSTRHAQSLEPGCLSALAARRASAWKFMSGPLRPSSAPASDESSPSSARGGGFITRYSAPSAGREAACAAGSRCLTLTEVYPPQPASAASGSSRKSFFIFPARRRSAFL